MPSKPTRIDITSVRMTIASHDKFNEWKANIFLYRQGSTVAVDLRFVDDPSQFSNIESVNPKGCSLIYAAFSQFPVYVELLKGSPTIWVELMEGVPARFSKMILHTSPR